jgi:hypothetical protein
MRDPIRIVQGQRGSALTEFAISLVFILPMLFYVIFIGDAIYLGAKANEVASAATWYATGRVAHDWNNPSNTPNKVTQAMNDGANWAMGVYGQLDSASPSSSLSPLKLLGATGQLDDLRCDNLGTGGLPQATANYRERFDHQHGVIRCQAMVETRNILVPKRSMAMLVHFDSYPPSIDPLRFCASGYGTCDFTSGQGSGIAVLLDDWGLTGDSEGDFNGPNPRTSMQQNKPFWDQVSQMWNDTGTGFGGIPRMAATTILEGGTLGDSPDDLRFMQERGSNAEPSPGPEFSNTDPRSPVDGSGSEVYPTVPWRSKAPGIPQDEAVKDRFYPARTQCYLGRKC